MEVKNFLDSMDNYQSSENLLYNYFIKEVQVTSSVLLEIVKGIQKVTAISNDILMTESFKVNIF